MLEDNNIENIIESYDSYVLFFSQYFPLHFP